MNARTVFLTAATLLVSLTAMADELTVGTPAPPLVVSEWIKGERFDKFEPGKTYVVEFWATWCGPCRASIPHLTELAHKYKPRGVRILGVDVREDDRSLVRPFVEKEMGDKMDYAVALDTVLEGSKPEDGVMAKTWLAAAGEEGIPTAFVVHDRKIVWIGHPNRLDAALEKAVAGEFTADVLALAARERRIELAKQRAHMKVWTLYRSGDHQKTLAAIEALTTQYPDLLEHVVGMKFELLSTTGEVESALDIGQQFFQKYSDNSNALNTLAWFAIDPKRQPMPDARVVQFALKAAQRANDLSEGKNFAILDTLAVALFKKGDIAAAIVAEEKALKLFAAQEENREHPYFKMFGDRLEEFRKAKDNP